MRLSILTLVLLSPAAHAGLHYSGEAFRELPARWQGFLPDHRALRYAAAPQAAANLPVPPLRDAYAAAASKLEATQRTRALTADEAADLGALYVRLGKPEKALEVLRPAARANPTHFRLAANLGTAWQLAGDLPQAMISLDEAVRLAPESAKPAEALHLKLVSVRAKEPPRTETLDNLFAGKPPADAVALVQKLALWLPADGRLLWVLAELAHDAGDVRTAANLLDGCVTEFNMGSAELRAKRQKYRAAADLLDQKGGHQRDRGTIVFKSPRALVRTLDPATLPAIKPDGVNRLPWAAIGETEIGPRGKPTFLKYIEQLDGRTVSVTGHMAPAGSPEAVITGFLLTEFPVGCWFCETPGPTQVITVELKEGESAELTRNVVKITGTLKLNRTDPERFPFTLIDAKLTAAD